MKTCSEKFGLLLAHFFLGEREALTVSGAARLSGLRPREARVLLEILAQEGLLCAGGQGERTFLADTWSSRYRCCLKAYRRQVRTS
ncbi:MAG: hypothetical protein A2X32_05110 [Elusimicrobia bacterium GWC2_64_44]|nr:MAG: hypothetical protein A2X32_05110 [Elusimicrobia bacterium GWC2_64_44]